MISHLHVSYNFDCCSIFKDHQLIVLSSHQSLSSTAYILYHTRFRLSSTFSKVFEIFLILLSRHSNSCCEPTILSRLRLRLVYYTTHLIFCQYFFQSFLMYFQNSRHICFHQRKQQTNPPIRRAYPLQTLYCFLAFTCGGRYRSANARYVSQ